MRLTKVRIKGYKSIIDTGYFDINELKTILVGVNEAGKTAILEALQKLNPSNDATKYNPLRDYPRSKYNDDIVCKQIDVNEYTFVEGHFILNEEDKESLPEKYRDVDFVLARTISNDEFLYLEGEIPDYKYNDLRNDIDLLNGAFDLAAEEKGMGVVSSNEVKIDFNRDKSIERIDAVNIKNYINKYVSYISDNEGMMEKYNSVNEIISDVITQHDVKQKLRSKVPIFVRYSDYFRIHPLINLEQLADRTRNNNFDDKQYDYGNNCLLKLLGFTAEGLSQYDKNAKTYDQTANRELLDQRMYQLNAASVKLTNVIKDIWNPDIDKQEANKIRIVADGQYLKVTVEDDLGVEVELDQRSEGFQWIVSFYVVFFAEAQDKLKNTILLLDEPGRSLHGLKQVEFRKTLDKLSEQNQVIFTTHSPFLVGPNELDKVRVVELTDRRVGTKVTTTVTAGDKASLLPLQEALGYDLAQTLFVNERNLVLEGLTDYWYIEAIDSMLKSLDKKGINDKIVKIPAGCASKVIYFATILYAQKFKVATVFDSDPSGNAAANQDELVHALGEKKIIRIKDIYNGPVVNCEIEDILRNTLVYIAKEKLGVDVTQKANKEKGKPIVDIFKEEMGKKFSKAQLSKKFMQWVAEDDYTQMPDNERGYCENLIKRINSALE